VGYPNETLGYYFYNLGILFLQQARRQTLGEKCRQKVYLEEVQDEPLGQEFTIDANVAERVEMPVAREEPPQPRRSERAHRATDKLNLMIAGECDILLLDNDEPMKYAEVMMDPDSEKCQSAMRSEIDSMDANQVWNLIDPPDGVKPIECKWIYKKKRDMDGNVHIHKD
jgi:hypothetical protein